jgi:protein TonB
MASTHLGSPPRQAAILATIAGLHVAVFIVAASGFAPRILWLEAPLQPVSVVLPAPQPLPVEAPMPSEPLAYDPPREPFPPLQIPGFHGGVSDTVTASDVPDGSAGAGPDLPTAETIPPSLRLPRGRLASLIDACYPSAARRLGEEGRIVVQASIDAAGRVAAWSLVQGSGFRRLDDAADCVLRRLEFVPGRRDGRAVPSSVLLPIVFRLD